MHQFNNSNTKKPPATALPSTPTKKPLPTPIQTHVNNQLFNRFGTTSNPASSQPPSSVTNSSGNSSNGSNSPPPTLPVGGASKQSSTPPNNSNKPNNSQNSIYSISRFNYTSSIISNSGSSGVSKSGVILDDDDETIFSKFGKGASASNTSYKNSFNHSTNSVNSNSSSNSSSSSSNNSSPNNKTTSNLAINQGRVNIQLGENETIKSPHSPPASVFRKDTLSDDGLLNSSGGAFSSERKKKLRKSGSSSSSLSFTANNPLLNQNATNSINSFSLLDENHHDRYDEFYDEEEYPSLESPTFALAPSVVKRHKMKQKSLDNNSEKKESIIAEDLLSSIEQSMEDLLDSDNSGFVFPTSSQGMHHSGEGLFGDSLLHSGHQQSSLPIKMFSSTSSSGSFKGSFTHNLDMNIPFIYTTSEEEIEISTTGSISTNTTSTSIEDYSGYFGSNTPTTVAGNQFHPFPTNNNNNNTGYQSPNTPPSSPSEKDARSGPRDRMITASPKQLPKVKSKAILEEDVVTSDSNSSSDEELYNSEKNSSENMIDYTSCENIDQMNEVFEREIVNSEKEKKISLDIQRLISNAPSFQSLLVLIKKMKDHSLIYHDNSQKIRSTVFQCLKKKIKELNNKYQLQSINSDLVNTRRDLDTIFQMCNLLPNEEIIYCMIQSPVVAEINSENDLNEIANLLENIQMNINQANSIQGYFRLFDGTKRWLIHIFTHNIRIVESSDSKEVTNSQSKRNSTSLLFLLQSQQNTMKLENFLLFIDRLVKLNFLKEYVHVLLDELMLTPFFVSLSAFEFIEFMGRFKGSMFSNTLKSYIIDKCCQLITQSAANKEATLLFEIITNVVDEEISLVFLKTLLLSSNLQQNYETIVKNPLCYHYFKFIKNTEKNSGSENFTKIQTDVSALMDIYFKLVFQLLDKTCTISTLHMVLKHEAQFMKLVYLMGDVGFNESHVKQLRQELLSFKTTLDAAQNFLTMFADDPNFFDTSLVLDTIIKIRRNMGEMVFKKIQKQVSELIPFGFEELAFFYELRTSEFFLVLWRDLYTKASNNEKHTIDSIKNKLVPDVKNKWSGFYKSIDSLSIKLNEFYSILRKCRYENRVDNLLSSTNVQYQEELLSVRMTFNGKSSDRSPNNEDLNWVSKRLNIINSFEKINLYRSYLPSLLLLVEHFEPYFTIDLKRDTDYIQLKKEANTLNQQSMLESQTLAMFEDQKNNFNLLLFTRFFKGFNDNQLSFMKLLCDSTGFSIIDWLLNYKSNSEFDNLVEICKSYTDSVKILQSLKSLVVVRDCISDFIYSNQVDHPKIAFISLENFKNSITKLEISNDDLSQLSNLKKNFTLLLSMFEEKTRSGGVQALYDLAAITERGQYEFNLADPSVILCKIMPSYPMMNTSQSRRLSLQQQIMTIDGLVELRNKLMLSEIPDNIKTLDDVNSRINLFVRCITLMLDIKMTLLDLCKQAHFEFQENYFKAIRASDCSPEYIQKYHAELLEKLEKWKKITENSRNGNYYMNLFRAKESLRVYELLKKYQQDSERSSIYDLLSILKLGDHNLELSDIENCITVLNLDFVKDCTAEEKMSKLCSFIESIFSRRDNTYRKSQYELPSNVLSKYSLNAFDVVFKIIKLQKEKEVMDAIISLYSLRGRLPLSEEVLLCNSFSTDMEDIELILNRWLNSNLKEKRDNIYCIANIQELPYVIQSKMLLKIQEILSSLSKKENTGKLVLIGGSDNNNARLLLEFSNYVDKSFKTLPKKYIVNIMKSYQGSNVKCVTSNRTGAGKSRYILKDIYLNKKKYSRVTVLEDSTVKEIVGLLWKTTNQNQGKEIAFHLALCSIIPKHMNSLLFELFYLGCVRDRETASVFHIVPNIQFYIEIPNSLCVPILSEFVYFCTALPMEEISTDESSLELVNYELINMEDDSIDIMCTDDNKVQYVCKFLKAFEENIFKNAAPSVPDFDPLKVSDLSLKACFKLLCKYTGFKPDNVSFSVVNNFVRFLYGQFVSTSRYVCFKNCVMEGSMQLFKHAMIDLMIKSARDLTAISVEKDFIISLAKKYEGKPYTEILLLQYIEMFEHRLSKWEEQASQHPLVVFYRSNINEITGIDLIGINTDKLELNEELKYSLSCNGIDLETPRDLSHDRAQEIIRNVAGLKQDESNEKKISNNYVLTVDNLSKVLMIYHKMKYNLPTILCGDSGVGKSELTKYLCSVLGIKLKRFAVNEGHTSNDILNWLNPLIAEARLNPKKEIIAFFDKVNTSNNLGLFKELICDNCVHNKVLPRNLKIVASCNPYRLRRYAGTDIEYGSSGNGQKSDILKENIRALQRTTGLDIQVFSQCLIYKVYPMPVSILDHVFNFGSLNPTIEQLYIRAILLMEINVEDIGKSGLFFDCFTELIFASQSFIRKVYMERSAVNLRDVKRCINLFKSFYQSLSKRNGIDPTFFLEESNFIIKNSIILSLGHCYYHRLSSKRDEFVKELEDLFISSRSKIASYFSYQKGDFINTLTEEQRYYTMHLNIPKGVALNHALRENIFMTLVCVLNRIPIFINGKSGSSKSLSLEILSTNLNGTASVNSFLRSLPSLEIFTYQCSQISTPESVKSCFESAKRYQKNSPNSIAIVLLNEVGLLEHSPSHPLKVVNKELEEDCSVSVIGLSNWTLDPNLINRAVYLTRPSPSTFELKTTLSGIVNSVHLDSTLYSLAKAYHDVYNGQQRKDFFGLRDFYHTVKFINRNFDGTLSPELLTDALARNFGGSNNEEFLRVLNIFFSCVGMNMISNRKSKLDYISENLNDTKARHLMLLTKNNAALSILFSEFKQLLAYDKAEVVFGPNFPNSTKELQVCMDIQRIKNAMSTGKTVVLVNCEQLYESLYDLFNLQYIEYDENRVVGISLGTYSRICSVHKNFRVIVIVDQDDAYSRLAKPLLNRFEKQTLHRDDLFDKSASINVKNLCSRLQSWVKTTFGDDEKPFVNTHKSLLQSLVLSLDTKQIEDPSLHDYLLDICKNSLLWITTADAIVRMSSVNNSRTREYLKIYFEKQEHRDLPHLLHFLFGSLQEQSQNGLSSNSLIYYGYFQLCLLTYSSVSINIDNLIQTSRDHGADIEYHSVVSMAELKSEMELVELVKQFFGKKITSTNGQHLLVLQCENMNLDLLNQTKFIIQKHRKCISPSESIGKNILLLINVVPGKSISSQHLIEFDIPWKFAFIDEIRPTETTIYEILNRPFTEQIQTTNVRQVIKNNFRTSLAMLRKFNTKINDITLLISRTNELIDSDECWKVINKKVLEICHDYFSQNQINFYSTYVANHINEYFIVVNTYYSAIQYCVERILIKSFTFLLAEIDRNDNLRLFFEYKSTNRIEGTNLWIKLLDDLKRPSVNHMLTRNEQTISSMAELLRWKPIEVKSDGNNNRIFQARFPFSYEVCRNLHSWRSVCESSRLGVFEALQKHIDMIYPFLNNLPREYSEFFLYDYMCICGVQCTVLTNEVQYEIIKKMLDADTSEGSNIAKILSFYWRQERRLQSYYVLFETFPKSVLQRKFLQKLLVPSLRISSIEEIDMLLFSVIYHNLDPRNIETSHDITVANQRRNIWVKTLTDIKSPVEVLITLIHSTSINLTGGPRTSMLKNIGYIHEKWQKLQFYKEYLQEIAIPLGIVREISMILWQNMKTKSLSSQSSLDLILYFLDLVNKIGDNIQNDKSNQSDESRKKTNITRFFEMFTAKFLVRRIGKEDDIEKPLVGALMGIIKGENEKFNLLMKQATQNLKVSILKKLLLNKNTKPHVNEELKEVFKVELSPKTESLDQSTLISYLSIYESVLQNIPEEQLSKLLESVSDNFVEVSSWKDIIKDVHLLAAIRCAMSIFSKRLILVVERGDSIRDLISSSPVARQLLSLFERPNFSFLKMVLLRLVVERKGRVFLLKTFRSRASPQFPWVSSLLQGFKYTDNIPQNVLMHVLNGLEELASCVDMIMSLRQQGDYNSKTESIIKLKASLEAIINTGQQIDIHSLKKLCYLAVVDKCYLSYCSENSNKDKFTKILTSEDEVNTQSCPIDITKLKNFLLKHVLRDDKEVHMTIKFASNAFNEDSFFFLNENTTLENLTLVHIIHHICSVALSNYATDQFWWLLLFDPTSLRDKYLPSVTDDARIQVINTIDNDTVSWYKCANNHVYVVDSCGYPTEFAMCPECGLPIGGFDHVPHFSNDKIKQDEDIAPTGYAVYEHFKERDLAATVRELSPASFRIIRLIIHSLLLAGNSTFPEREEEYRGVFHKTMSSVENLNEFLLGHIKNDWSILCELLGGQNEEKASVLLFNILEFFSYSSKQLETKKRSNPKLPYTSRDISTKVGRSGWETHFNGCVTMVTENAAKKYQLYYKQLDSIQKKGNDVITNILLFSSAGAPQELKQPILPLSDPISQIWNIKPPITYDQFKSYFIADKAERKYPILSLFIRNEHLLYPTRYIPHVVKWQKLVTNTFSRRIDRHYARTRTVRDVFSEFMSSLSLSPIHFQLGAEKASIEKIFDGWAKSFNHSWKYIDRYQCLPLPAWCKNVSMSKDTPLSFSIPDEQDEGICALALIQFLVDKHNDIIDRAGKLLNKTSTESSPIEISSRFISKHHLLSFNIEEELMPVITDSELDQDTNKQNSYKFDYQRVEQFIVNKYLSGKPKIKLELENFTFLNETRYSSGFGQVGGPVSELKSKIKQVELPTDMKQAIVSELRGGETSLDLFQSCIRQIEECISFLQAISGSNNLEEVEKMSLIDYLQNILLVDPKVTKQTLAKSYTVIVHVKLCHLVSLWSLLENELSPGASIESSSIANKYKKVLPAELVQKLDEFKNILSPDDCSMLVSSMKELLLSYFTSETLDSEIPLKQMLEITPAIGAKSQEGNKLGDYEWLLQLSDEFKTCHLFEVYRHLSMQLSNK